MANVEVYEMAAPSGGHSLLKLPPLAKHVLTVGSTSGADLSAAFNRSATMITAMSTASFRFVIGASPTSTGTHFLWPASTPLTAEIVAGHKFLALSSTST